MSNILKSIRLDHNIMKSRYPMFIIGFVLGAFLSFISKTPIYGALIVMIISAPLTGQYFSIYEKNNLEKLYGILPLKKAEVVIGRYIYAMGIIVINGAIAALLAYIVSLFTHQGMSGSEFVTYVSGGFLYVCLMVAVIFPLYFRFSFSKVYVFSNLPFYLIFIITFAFTRKTNVLEQAGPVAQYLPSPLAIAAIGLGLGLTLLALSCLLSCALIQGKQAESLPAQEPGKRLYFIDNLRTFMVILVVLQHLGVIYSTFTLIMMLNQAYFMGLLFLLSGYFTPGSFERKGPVAFLEDRLLRLGIPTLVYAFLLSPIAAWCNGQLKQPPAGSTAGVRFALGPLWFAVMLLVFDLIYLAWRTIRKNRPERQAPVSHTQFSFRTVALFTLALAAASYLLRIVIPYATSWLDFPSLAYLPQYVSFFLIGMLASRRDWLRSAPGSLGQLGFVLAVIASLILLPAAFVGPAGAFIGNGTWQSAVFALWDSIFAVGVGLAFITFFRRFLGRGKKFGRFLAEHSFTVYIIHVPVIFLLALVLRIIPMDRLLEVGLATVIGIPLCFGAAYLVRLIPYAKKII